MLVYSLRVVRKYISSDTNRRVRVDKEDIEFILHGISGRDLSSPRKRPYDCGLNKDSQAR